MTTPIHPSTQVWRSNEISVYIRRALEQYRDLVRKHQGDRTMIVETLDERETVSLLGDALEKAREAHSDLRTG
ncbi:MAG: hypothetical protein M3092_01200 [Actinomycetia bacterium]|nr:hypothetical protein [Actinomycetes bacterium]